MFRDEFAKMGRKDQFSYEALGVLFDYLTDYEESTGEKLELDVIALCCDWTEMSEEEITKQYDEATPSDIGREADILHVKDDVYLIRNI
jgi:hypothetical protein